MKNPLKPHQTGDPESPSERREISQRASHRNRRSSGDCLPTSRNLKAEDINIIGNTVEVSYDVTAPMCPFSAAIGVMIKYAIEKHLGLDVRVKMKSGHLQEKIVERLLTSESAQEELLEKLKQHGILQQCVRI